MIKAENGADHRKVATCPPKIAYRMLEAAQAAGLSKAKLYEEIAAGRLKSIKRCGRRLILREDLESFVRGDEHAVA